MTNLPSGWAVATLADVTMPRKENAEPSELGNMPFLGMDHVEAHTARLLGSQPVGELKSRVAVFKKGDLLYGRLRPYLNKVHLAEFDGASSTEFMVFPPSVAIEQRFLQILLRTPEYRTLAERRSTGSRPRVKFESISDFEFALPPLAEQHRIVRKLNSLSNRTAAIRNHLAAIAKLVERYRSFVLDRHMVHAEAENADWKPKTLEAVRSSEATIRYGVVQPGEISDEGVQLIRVKDMIGGKIAWGKLRKVSEETDEAYAKARVKNDDILISVVGTIGKVAIVDGLTENTNISRAVSRIRPDKEKVNPKWLFWRLNASDIQARFKGDAREVARKTLNISLLRKTPFKLPPLKEQHKIVRRIEAAFAEINSISVLVGSALILCNRLDQRIIMKAFAGELVLQDPNDEPASALLSRIRKARANAPKISRLRHTKADAMKKHPIEILLSDSTSWPKVGLPSEDVAKRVALPHDQLRDALFELMSGAQPRLEQVFDKGEARMRLRRTAQ